MLCYSLLLLAAIVAGTRTRANPLVPMTKQLFRRNVPVCDKDQCIESVMPLMSDTTILKLHQMDDAATLDSTCSIFNDALHCLNTNCQNNEEVQLIYEAAMNITSYVCTGEGRQALLAGANCWNNTAFKEGLQECMTVAGSLIWMDYELCDIVEYYRTCAQGKTVTACNENAATFLDYILYKGAYQGAFQC